MGIASAIIGAAAASFFGSSITVLGVSLGAFGSFLFRAALGVALNALTPKPKQDGSNRGYQVTTKGSALDHQIIYGRMRVGGVIVYDSTTGNKNKFLHRIIALAGHEVEDIDEVYINDELLTLDSNGEVTAPSQYVGQVRVNKHFGSPDQLADSDLVAEDSQWTSEHRLRGIAYIYVRLKFEQSAFPTGVPDITATVKGKKVYDPRTNTTAWSDNPALCLRDYLTSDYGLSEESANIDDDIVKTAANVCDETDTLDGETRYTCNGAFVTQIVPADVINDLTSAMGGLVWYAQGEWRMKPAYYVAPTVTLTEDDLRSNIAVKTRHSRRDNYNTVAGTFRGEESDWQVTDYPPVTNQDFIDADNGQESILDLELPFTDNSVEARRIARIALERNRQQLTVSGSFGLKAFQVQVGDIVKLSIDRFGWTEKEFEVSSWTFGLTQDQDLQVQMTLREISESVFDEVDDGIVYERDNTELLSPFDVPSIGISVTGQAKVIRENVLNSLVIEVTVGAEERVDQIEVEYKPSSQTEWEAVGFGSPGLFEVVDVEVGQYDVRARVINSFGVRGDFETVSNVTIDSFGESPNNVENFNYEIADSTLNLFWDAATIPGLSHYTIRYNPNTTGVTWGNATTAVEKVARPAVSTSLPVRSGTYLIRPVNKNDIASEDATSLVVLPDELLDYTTTETQTEDSTFSGTKTGTTIDTGRLRLTSPVTAGDTGEYEFSSVIDTGSVRRVWTYIVAPNIRVNDSAGLFDDTPGFFDSILGLFDAAAGGANLADTNIKFFISTTEDDPTGTPTWSDWKQFRAGFFYGRAFRYKIEMTTNSDQTTPSLTELDAIVEYN